MKRYLTLFLLFLLLFQPVVSQRKKVGLVLSGGGAKGAAHVGVLKVLEEAGIPIDYIAGTSIGAIVGGLYSINHDIYSLDSLFRYQDWTFLLRDDADRRYKMYPVKEYSDKYLISLSYNFKGKKVQDDPPGLITGHNLYNLFSKLTVGYHEVESFSDLPIPFACVAVDLVSGKEIVLDKGSLPKAMRASMAIPGVFKPVAYDNMLLIDGGLLNNIPTNVVKEMGAEVIIGVDLSSGWKTEMEVKQFSGMLGQLLNILLENEYSEKNRLGLDLYLNPDLKGFEVTSFSQENIEQMIQRGEDIAKEHWNELLLLKEQIFEGQYPEKQLEKKKYTMVDSLQLASISFDGITDNSEDWLRKHLSVKDNSTISMKEIEKAITEMYVTGLFSQIEYQLGNDNPRNIRFLLKNKPMNKLNIGLRFDTEDFASILLNTTINHPFMRGSFFSATARFNNNPYLLLLGQIGNLYEPNLSIAYQVKYNDFPFSFVSHSPEIAYVRFLHDMNYGIGLHYDYYDYDEKRSNNHFQELTVTTGGFLSFFAKFAYDSRDQGHFPTKGLYMNADAVMYANNQSEYKTDSPFFSIKHDLTGVYSVSNSFCIIPSFQSRVLLGNNVPSIYRNCMGGELEGRYLPQQLSFPGIQRIQYFDNSLLVAKLSLRNMFWKNHYISISGAFANCSDKLNMKNSRNAWGSSIQYTYNNDLIGPAALQLSYSNQDKRLNVFLSIGYNF